METLVEGLNRDEYSYGMNQLRYQQAVLATLTTSLRGGVIPLDQRIILLELAAQLGDNATSALR